MKNSYVLKFSTLALIAVTFFGCEPDHTTITAIRVNKIKIINYPILTGSSAWDDPLIGSTSGPDIAWSISGSDNYSTTTHFTDCTGNVIEFTTTNNSSTLPVFLNDPNGTYTLGIWDIDGLDGSDFASTDDLMAEVTFTPYSSGDTGTMYGEFEDSDLKIQIEFTYLFE